MTERDQSPAPSETRVDPGPVIDITDAAVEAADQRVADRASDVVPPSGRPQELMAGHRLVTIDGGDRWMQAEAFVYDIYCSIGYTQPNDLRRVEELARFADRSRFHAVVDDNDAIIGTVRTIHGCYNDLPVGNFPRTRFHHRDPVCELSSLVVDPTVRSTGVIEHLYRAGWLDAWRRGSNAVVALIDDWLLDLFRSAYRLPFDQIGSGRHFMGSYPVPVGMALSGERYYDLAVENPEFWAWTLESVTRSETRAWDLPAPATSPNRRVADIVR